MKLFLSVVKHNCKMIEEQRCKLMFNNGLAQERALAYIHLLIINENSQKVS